MRIPSAAAAVPLLRTAMHVAAAILLCPQHAAAADTGPAIKASATNAVPTCASPENLMSYLRSRNPAVSPAFTYIAAWYRHEGEALGLRWDYAFFQMLVDTASLSFRRPNGAPGAVRAEQNNFAGLGATGGDVSGESFPDVATGVRAHLQHVAMYAGERIPAPVADRTRKVQSWGVLTAWHASRRGPVTFRDLALRWAPGDSGYGAGIEAVAKRFAEAHCRTAPHVASAAAPPVTSPGAALAAAAMARARSEGTATRSSLGAGPSAPAAPSDAARVPRQARETPEARVAALPDKAVAPADPAGEAIRAMVTGRTFVLDAAFGNKVPILFNADGTMQGRASGMAARYLGAANDEGRWWTERGRLCQKWKLWLEKETQCLRLRSSGETIHWTRDDGRTGTARFASR